MGKPVSNGFKTCTTVPATIARIIQGIIMTIINGQLGGWLLHLAIHLPWYAMVCMAAMAVTILHCWSVKDLKSGFTMYFA